MRKQQAQARIKIWLLRGRAITPRIALDRFGCFRLSSVIHRLRREHGMDIDTHIVNSGRDYSFARYTLIKHKAA